MPPDSGSIRTILCCAAGSRNLAPQQRRCEAFSLILWRRQSPQELLPERVLKNFTILGKNGPKLTQWLFLLRRPGRSRIYSGRERRRVIQYMFPRIYARQHYAPPRARNMSFSRSRKVLRNLSLRKFSHSSRGTGECHGEMIVKM